MVSKINDCTYCVEHYSPRLIVQGLDANISDHILDDEVPGFDEIDILVRDYTVQVTEKAPCMRNAIFEDL